MDDRPRIGHRVVELDSVDSTNSYASRGLARGELGHGTAVVALEQTGGRGQRGRQWTTAKGEDLAASFVLQPQGLAVRRQFALSKAVALAVHGLVCEVLEAAGKDPTPVRIKWPNDVLVDRNKVAGILIANELHGEQLASSIVGIGVNVNSGGWPSDFLATSLLQETRVRQDLRGLLGRLCAGLDRWWERMREEPDAVATAYRDRLWALDRFAPFLLDGQPWTARPLDVDDTGRLLVEDDRGHVAAYGLERLRFVRG